MRLLGNGLFFGEYGGNELVLKHISLWATIRVSFAMKLMESVGGYDALINTQIIAVRSNAGTVFL